jgi:hypothetical protein
MIRRLGAMLAGWAARALDDAVPPERLHDWLQAHLAESLPADPQAAALWSLARQAAAAAHLVPDPAQTVSQLPQLPSSDVSAAPLVAGRLVPGAARRLVAHTLQPGPNDGPLTGPAELLLRHVEIRRRGGLPVAGLAWSAGEAWIERHAVAVFFSRQARRSGDLRLLNAALKLNDWAFRRRRAACGEDAAWFLWALAEQEWTLARWCGPEGQVDPAEAAAAA